jgi:hypothetical protein
MDKLDLLAEIETFLRSSGMGPSYFGKVAVGNSDLVKRLRKGRPILTVTESQVRAFIAARQTGDAA